MPAALILTSPVFASERLNVLFLAVDDMNCSLGCYGNEEVSSPHIDALAERGVLFERAYCQQTVCNPSRASVLTGLRPDTIRVWDLKTDFRKAVPNAVTLPQLFKRHGYHTQGIGKIFHNTGDLNDEPSWSMPSVMHEGRHSDDYRTPENRTSDPPKKGPSFERADLPDEAYLDGKIADAASGFLRNVAEDQPFFLAVGFWRPHLPFLAPERYWNRYDPNSLTLAADSDPPRGVPEIALHDSRELYGYTDVVRGQLDDDQRRQLWHGYYAGISYVDAQIGKVVEALDETGLADRTVIVLWSDHGFHLGQHGLWCKTSCFELDDRVPLIVAPPRYPNAGDRTDAIVELLDIYPTLAELCGLTPPQFLQGRSLMPLLARSDAMWEDAAITQHPRPAYYKKEPEAMGYSLRTDRFRYTEWRQWKTGLVLGRELYDHEHDPEETINLATDDQTAIHADVLAQRLRKTLTER